MSHFSVMVIHPEDADIHEIMAPYQEYDGSHSFPKEYLEEVDITDEHMQVYSGSMEVAVPKDTPEGADLRGIWKYTWAEEFSRKLTDDELNDPARLRDALRTGGTPGNVPDHAHFGYKIINVPYADIFTPEEFASYQTDYPILPYGVTPDWDGDHRYGSVILDKDGKLSRIVRITNPYGYWDWFEVGGRWSGFLPLKGQGGNCARKGDIDFTVGRAEAEQKALETYRKATQLLEAHGLTRTWKNFDAIIQEYPDATAEERHTAYLAQPAVKLLAVNMPGRNEWWMTSDTDELLLDEQAYVDLHVCRKHRTYAIIKDGEWHARGEMGWWGISLKEQPEAEWNKEFWSLVASTPDDHYITIVDCHI